MKLFRSIKTALKDDDYDWRNDNVIRGIIVGASIVGAVLCATWVGLVIYVASWWF